MLGVWCTCGKRERRLDSITQAAGCRIDLPASPKAKPWLIVRPSTEYSFSHSLSVSLACTPHTHTHSLSHILHNQKRGREMTRGPITFSPPSLCLAAAAIKSSICISDTPSMWRIHAQPRL
ncbi:hypothetical protein IF1G_06993 [Cordyceps javanica]|uniref:Uncharacterized protein n=1 Tax=Cordyceps javanica TaxID=43265 RepID=A0A545UXB2_9HYPO|nr:hypothetical protein IF1G_06993 [Cordyceps javanica]